MSSIRREECLVHTVFYGLAERLEQVLQYAQTAL